LNYKIQTKAKLKIQKTRENERWWKKKFSTTIVWYLGQTTFNSQAHITQKKKVLLIMTSVILLQYIIII